MTLEHLKRFRQDLYELLGKGSDATMDLMDAVLTTKSVQSFAELSLSPVFRRKWPSLYEAIEDVRPQRDELMKLCINKIPDIQDKRIILAGDHTPLMGLSIALLIVILFLRLMDQQLRSSHQTIKKL